MRLALPPISCKVATPADLAQGMVKALGDYPTALWLEPSHGTGVFVKEVSKIGVSKNRLFAIDLDPTHFPADRLAQSFRRIDFLRWAQATNLRFDRIIGNPPYISIKRLQPSLQATAAKINDINGQPIGVGANVWYAFVLSSMRLLNKNGSLAFVLPSAAEFAHYTAEIRNAVKDSFATLDIYRCKRSLFENVQEGTVVAIAREYGHQPFRYRRREFEDKASLIAALSNNKGFSGKPCPSRSMSTHETVTTLDSVARIRLGGVTGDARYFLMDDEKRRELRLPLSAMTPVVSRARQLKSAIIDRDRWDKLKKKGERVWLFSPPESRTNNKAVQRYLQLKPESGGCNKAAFKVLARDPWYRVPLPEKADAFISGMSQVGPWLVINEMEKLSATNTLYVVSFKDRNPDVWYMWATAMLTSTVQKQIQRIGRRYADGLIKFEPGPLGKIELPKMKLNIDYRTLYCQAFEALLDSDLVASKKIANSCQL